MALYQKVGRALRTIFYCAPCRLGIEAGEMVRIVSARGAVEVAARIVLEPEFLPGVCEMYHGWEECRINLLTFDDVNNPISGFPLLKGVPVRIEKTS